MSTERHIAFNILWDFEQNRERLDVLERRHVKNMTLDPQQQRHLKNLYAGVVRWQARLDAYIKKLYDGNFKKMQGKTRVLLRMGLYELDFMQSAAHGAVNAYVNLTRKLLNKRSAGLVNAILRNFLRTPGNRLPEAYNSIEERIATEQSMPLWMVKRWTKLWGAAFCEELCIALNELPDFDVRINIAKISAPDFKERLKQKAIEFAESGLGESGVRLKQIQPLLAAGFFEHGLCSIQDESAALPGLLLDVKADEWFLDACSAPGGKLTQVLEQQPSCKALALESDATRARTIQANLRRLGLKAHVVIGDARSLPFRTSFDAVLCDAPCSGLGVMQKHPDIKWRRTFDDVKKFSKLQTEIVKSLAEALAPAGRMVYSTCTIDPLENEETIKSLINENTGTELKQPPNNFPFYSSGEKFVRTFSHLNKCDGSFCALLKRV